MLEAQEEIAGKLYLKKNLQQDQRQWNMNIILKKIEKNDYLY